MKTRNLKYDILKLVGTLCIFLAHVNPPSLLFQLRNFDVILMMMISASLFFDSYNEPFNRKDLLLYLKKRIIRLIIPTWIFLTIYFLIVWIVDKDSIDLNLLLSTYSFHDGIGYVWIIRIYMIEALLLPFFNFLLGKIKLKYAIILTLFMYVIYEVLCYFNVFSYNIILNDYAAYIIPTFLIVLLSYIINKNISSEKNKNQLFVFAILFVLVFCLLCMYYYKTTGSFHTTNYRKYPFRLYYLSYAISFSTLMFYITSFIKNNQKFFDKIFIFTGKSSLWIYLWHILFLKLFSFLNFPWFFTYLCIIVCSFLITLFQNKIIDFIEKKSKIKHSFYKVFRG